jgi:hypothetical protein
MPTSPQARVIPSPRSSLSTSTAWRFTYGPTIFDAADPSKPLCPTRLQPAASSAVLFAGVTSILLTNRGTKASSSGKRRLSGAGLHLHLGLPGKRTLTSRRGTQIRVRSQLSDECLQKGRSSTGQLQLKPRVYKRSCGEDPVVIRLTHSPRGFLSERTTFCPV